MQSAQGERRKRWSFYTDSDGLWIWRMVPPDGMEQSSVRSFPRLTECIADARRNGYVLWNSRERRHAS